MSITAKRLINAEIDRLENEYERIDEEETQLRTRLAALASYRAHLRRETGELRAALRGASNQETHSEER